VIRFSVVILLFYFLLPSNCISQLNSEYKNLRCDLSEILFSNGAITKEEYSIKKGFTIYSLHQDKIDRQNLKKGIYGLTTKPNVPAHFFIYDDDLLRLLNLYTFEEFLDSIKTLLIYCFEKNYCKEIIYDYTFRLIRTYSNFHRRSGRKTVDPNCKDPRRWINSTYNINSLKLSFAEELVKLGKIKDIDDFFDYPDRFNFFKTDFHYGLPEENNDLDIGFYGYNFVYTDNINPVIHGDFLLTQGNFNFLEVDNTENVIKTIQNIIVFGEDYNVCSEKTIWFIEKITNDFFTESCLENIVVDLP